MSSGLATPETGESSESGDAAPLDWGWGDVTVVAAPAPTPRQIRIRGTVQFLVGATVATLFYLYGPVAIAYAVYTFASLVLLSALTSPTGLYAGFDRLFHWTGRLVGRALTWALMVPLFYGVFLPFGKLFRRGARDRMRRHMEPDAATYWEPHSGNTAASTSHTRQY
jgi:hypothetical protein